MIFVSFEKNTNYNEKQEKEDLTSQEIVEDSFRLTVASHMWASPSSMQMRTEDAIDSLGLAITSGF